MLFILKVIYFDSARSSLLLSGLLWLQQSGYSLVTVYGLSVALASLAVEHV